MFHPGGSVLATCSGKQWFPDYDADDDDNEMQQRIHLGGDGSVKIWAL